MFKKFFNALTSLTEAAEALASTFREANTNLREKLGLDHQDDVPQLEHETNGKAKRRVKAE